MKKEAINRMIEEKMPFLEGASGLFGYLKTDNLMLEREEIKVDQESSIHSIVNVKPPLR